MGTFLFLFAVTIGQTATTGNSKPNVAQVLGPVISLDGRTDGKLFAAGSGGDLLLLSPKEKDVGFSVRSLPLVTNPQRITSIAFSPDGKKIAVADGVPGVRGSVRILEAEAPNKTFWKSDIGAHKDLILSLAWSPDGSRLATTGHDRLVLIHDLVGKHPPVPIRDHSDAVTAVVFLGKTSLASTGYDRVVKIFDALEGKRRQTLAEATDWLFALTANSTGSVLISGGKDKLLRLYQVQKDGSFGLTSSAFAHSGPILQATFSPDGKQLFTLGEDKTIKIWVPETLTQKGSPIALDGFSHRFAYVPGSGAFLVGDQKGQVTLLNGPNFATKSILWPEPPSPPKVAKWAPSFLFPGQPVRIRIDGTGLQRVQFQSETNSISVRPVSLTDNLAELELQIDPSKPGTDKATLIANHEGKPISSLTLEVDRFPRKSLIENTLPGNPTQPANRVNLNAEQIASGVTLDGIIDRPGFSWNIGLPLSKGQELGMELLQKAGGSWVPELDCYRPDGSIFLRGKNLLGIKADTAGMWEVRVRDEQWRGSPQTAFRLEIGPIPVINGAFPRVIPAGPEGIGACYRLLGVNLPSLLVTNSQGGQPNQKMNSPLLHSKVRPAGKAELTFSASKETTDRTRILEVGMGGQFLLEKDHPRIQWDFKAKKGEPLVIKVEARRHGSPLDPFLEILDTRDQPVSRARLQSIAKTNVTFRDHNSSQPGIRIDTWGDLLTNDYLLAGNELMRIRNLPRNPDDDCQFYSTNNLRRGYLGTTPVHHPNGQEMFRVKIHPPGTPLPENGMPNVDIPWFNDDGDPEFPKDSMILFDPPSDGVFRARISDAQGLSGDDFFGRLALRKAEPSFRAKAQRTGSWVEGGAALIQVTVDRLDGFQGPVDLQWETRPGWILPAGRLGDNDDEVILPIASQTPSTSDPTAWKLIAKAKSGNEEVTREIPVTSGKPVKGYGLTIKAQSPEVRVTRGGQAKCSFEISRPADFKGRIPIDFKGLPFGCKVLDIGLNGILMIPGETKRTVEIACEDWVPLGKTPFVITARQEGKDEINSSPLILDVVGAR